MTDIFISSWRSPAAGVRLLNRSSCSALRWIWSAAVFFSTRATRLVPGIIGYLTAGGEVGLFGDYINDTAIAYKISAEKNVADNRQNSRGSRYFLISVSYLLRK
jgi:hypothetical protein